MDGGKRCLVLLLSVCFLYTSGVLLFTRGFLLKRFTLEKQSSCERPSPGDEVDDTAERLTTTLETFLQRGCWAPRSYARAVIVVIDGLRYDFVRWNYGPEAVQAYENRLGAVRQAVESRRALLFPFMADPPTTTMQRLKGLVTGSLPTFVDIGGNFATEIIDEDNLIGQLVARGKRVKVMGDDTWGRLFPRPSFSKALLFPSFNVRDLHTVDNGILDVLRPELEAHDWDVLVAHFLGVDHCGHRHGPHHAAMADKLSQMNSMLKLVMDSIDDDTILFVMGDHGMTDTGDHGGESLQEVLSALFVYSPQMFLKSNQSSLHRQIDFVPTFALLLGLPIPFNNLGTVITELFQPVKNDSVSRDLRSSLVLALNVFQVQRYLEEYNVKGDGFPEASFHLLRRQFHALHSKWKAMLFTNESYLDLFQSECRDYLEKAINMCQNSWSKFDPVLMTLGIGLIIGTLMLGLLLRQLKVFYSSWRLCLWQFFIASLVLLTVTILPFYQDQLPNYFEVYTIVIGVCATGLGMKMFLPRTELKNFKLKMSIENFSSTCILVLYCASFFSNSFVINEAALLNYFLQFVLWWFSFLSFINKKDIAAFQQTCKAEKKSFSFLNKGNLFILNAVGVSGIMRLSLNFIKCREEQYWCEASFFSPLSPLASTSGTNTLTRHCHHFIAILSLIILPALLVWWLKRGGNLNGYSLNVTSTKCFLFLASAFICYYWSLQLLPQTLLHKLPFWHQLWIPRIAFILLAIVFLCCFISPLFIYVLPHSSYLDIYPRSFTSIRNVYFYVKNNWQRHLSSVPPSMPIPIVYGLASVYSAYTLTILVTFLLLTTLLLGNQLAPAIILLLSALVSTLNISVLRQPESSNLIDSLPTKWSDVVMWGLLSSLFFYSTGHQPVISAIPWNAAFIGSEGDFESYIIPTLKILANLFCSQIVFALALPLLILWPFALHIHFGKSSTKEDSTDNTHDGEFYLYKENDLLVSALFQCFLDYLLFDGMKTMAITAAAAYHKRHLMLWKIFAPRFMFEAISTIVVQVTVCLAFVFFLRLNSSIDSWICSLEQDRSATLRRSKQ